MDEIRRVDQGTDLLVILGPTASGKTALAVELAKRLNGAVISADSRQVYRGMDIGTGKDLAAYGDIPYFLIDVVDAGERYHVTHYQEDVHRALAEICRQGKQPILCGGTGFYIQAVLQGFDYSTVPLNSALRAELEPLAPANLVEKLQALPLPTGFRPDMSTRKRLIRAIEIATWCHRHSLVTSARPTLPARLFGIHPPLEVRRQRITERLKQRLENGLVEEVQHLLNNGISAETLMYYGLEYKYTTQYLLGKLDYDTFVARLNTEIHRYAKRQMTYFRKMEKDGLPIHWLKGTTITQQCAEIMGSSSL